MKLHIILIIFIALGCAASGRVGDTVEKLKARVDKAEDPKVSEDDGVLVMDCMKRSIRITARIVEGTVSEEVYERVTWDQVEALLAADDVREWKRSYPEAGQRNRTVVINSAKPALLRWAGKGSEFATYDSEKQQLRLSDGRAETIRQKARLEAVKGL